MLINRIMLLLYSITRDVVGFRLLCNGVTRDDSLSTCGKSPMRATVLLLCSYDFDTRNNEALKVTVMVRTPIVYSSLLTRIGREKDRGNIVVDC